MTTNQVPDDRFCDLVMKGGITSGVVYPPAIWELAQHYRFKNIGGTSAGAIAAAAAAAAEYRRRMQGTNDGFDALRALPETLGKTAARGKKTQLLRLFQPDPACRRLFTILVTSLNAPGTFQRIALALLGCVKGYWLATVISFALTGLIAWGSGSALATALFLLASLSACIGLGIYLDVTRNVVSNNYGLCKGLTTTPKDGPALTDWLHALIQDIAGIPHNVPLTFGDLWRAKGFPPPGIELTETEKASLRSINLEMFTTNLSHGRPYVFPHTEPTARLFFREEELEKYLPANVMNWMMKKSIPYAPSQHSPNSDPPPIDPTVRDLREIPQAADFPVLLATRMSLSFPFLFSAVPLWAIDYEAPRGARKLQRCLFSDGGISSNFPVHLFDGLLPSWPTFGIELEPALPELPKSLVFLPHEYGQGIADTWNRFDQQTRPASRFGGFLTSILGTMQNWNDNTLARSAGVRDRVVRLRLKENEGGMNLAMPPELIRTIAGRGELAAQALIRRFLSPLGTSSPKGPDERADLLGHRKGPTESWQGWDFQRWVRLEVLIRTLADQAPGLIRSLGDRVPFGTNYETLLQESRLKPPPAQATPLTEEQAQALTDLLRALGEVSRKFCDRAPHYPDEPIPSAEIRVRPKL